MKVFDSEQFELKHEVENAISHFCSQVLKYSGNKDVTYRQIERKAWEIISLHYGLEIKIKE